MTDTSGDIAAYVRYRLEKARETYHAAEVLAQAECWNSVVNRLYYSCFYAASAVLPHMQVSAKTHSGVLGKFSEHLVRTGVFDIEEFRVYAKLLSWRTKGDYGDLFDFERDDVAPLMPKVRHFVDKATSLT